MYTELTDFMPKKVALNKNLDNIIYTSEGIILYLMRDELENLFRLYQGFATFTSYSYIYFISYLKSKSVTALDFFPTRTGIYRSVEVRTLIYHSFLWEKLQRHTLIITKYQRICKPLSKKEGYYPINKTK